MISLDSVFPLAVREALILYVWERCLEVAQEMGTVSSIFALLPVLAAGIQSFLTLATSGLNSCVLGLPGVTPLQLIG